MIYWEIVRETFSSLSFHILSIDCLSISYFRHFSEEWVSSTGLTFIYSLVTRCVDSVVVNGFVNFSAIEIRDSDSSIFWYTDQVPSILCQSRVPTCLLLRLTSIPSRRIIGNKHWFNGTAMMWVNDKNRLDFVFGVLKHRDHENSTIVSA